MRELELSECKKYSGMIPVFVNGEFILEDVFSDQEKLFHGYVIHLRIAQYAYPPKEYWIDHLLVSCYEN